MLPINALAALAAMAFAAPASAETLVDEQVSASEAVDQTCFTRDLSGEAGVASQTIETPTVGEIEARLEGASGDWDLALIDAAKGGTVGASAYQGASEVAQGYAFTGERIVVQACRRSGDAETASLTVDFTPIDTSGEAPRISLVRVITPRQPDRDRLVDLGLNLTEHGGDNYVGAVLHGARDRNTLEAADFDYRVDVADLVAADAKRARQDARFSAAGGGGRTLPSGQTTYRRLFDYSEDMKQLADRNPHLVKPITLPFRTYEGRRVEGIEITQNPDVRDGKPVFLQMGVHHAREWPSGEHAMEWAYELVRGYKDGNDRIQRLVNRTRTIVVPIVNPDGFNISRETGELQGAGNGRDADSLEEEITQLIVFGQEYWRKNCRFPKGPPDGSCAQPGNGLASPGVDPNRNYGGFWGGPGASGNPLDQTYYGPGPFSEPETRNIRALISDRQVVSLITNHTFSNLVLRPPGLAGEPDTPDEPLYRRLGAEMTRENGYSNLKSYQL